VLGGPTRRRSLTIGLGFAVQLGTCVRRWAVSWTSPFRASCTGQHHWGISTYMTYGDFPDRVRPPGLTTDPLKT